MNVGCNKNDVTRFGCVLWNRRDRNIFLVVASYQEYVIYRRKGCTVLISRILLHFIAKAREERKKERKTCSWTDRQTERHTVVYTALFFPERPSVNGCRRGRLILLHRGSYSVAGRVRFKGTWGLFLKVSNR